MAIRMYDSITADTVPADAPAVAGYIGGHWPSYHALVARFPRALHLSIAVNASEDAECLDVETGDATPSQAPAWVRRQLARGVHRPGLYANLSTMPAILDALAAAGIHRNQVRLWVAHWTYSAVRAAAELNSFDAVQYTNNPRGGRDGPYDTSLCRNDFFGPPPPPPDPHHYGWFAADELPVVQRYDQLRRRPFVNRPRLRPTRDRLMQLAVDIINKAEEQRTNRGPALDVHRREWRLEQLLHRAHGDRLA